MTTSSMDFKTRMLMSKNVNNDVTMNPATHLRQHIKLVVCVFVVLIAFEDEKCIKAIIIHCSHHLSSRWLKAYS